MKEFVKQHQSCHIRCQSTRFFTDFNLTAGRNLVTGSKPTTQSSSTVRLQILEDNPKNFLGDLQGAKLLPPHPTFNIQVTKTQSLNKTKCYMRLHSNKKLLENQLSLKYKVVLTLLFLVSWCLCGKISWIIQVDFSFYWITKKNIWQSTIKVISCKLTLIGRF